MPVWTHAVTLISFASAIFFGFLAYSDEPGSRKAWFRFGIFASIACFFFLRSLSEYGTIDRASRDWVTGPITSVARHGGKYPSSSFQVGNERESVHLSAYYIGPALQQGTTIKAQYVSGKGSLTRLMVLDGPYAGLDLSEDDGSDSISELVVGVVILFLGFLIRAKSPDGAFTPRGERLMSADK